MGNILPTQAKAATSLPPPPPPSSWYGYTVHRITQAKDWCIQKITLLVMKFVLWAVQVWMRWNGVQSPFDNSKQSTSINDAIQNLSEPKKPPSPEETQKLMDELLKPTKLDQPETIPPISSTVEKREIPPFSSGDFSAQIKKSPEHKCLIIEQVVLPGSVQFRSKIKFCRDLIIHVYQLSEEMGWEGALRIETLQRKPTMSLSA